MEIRYKPIGVFDSGVGGVSVLREMVRRMPHEHFLYFGDSANAPYGTKPAEIIRELTVKNVEYLMDRDVKAVAVACNTATGAAVRVLREKYPDLPIVGIEPAIKPAVLENPGGLVYVLATPLTLKQDKFRVLLAQYEDMADIRMVPCPGLMEFVERGELTGDRLREHIAGLIAGVAADVEAADTDMKLAAGPAAVVLGCTHYPFVRDAISEVVGDNVKIYDGGPGTARELERRIREAGLLSDSVSAGEVIFENSYTDVNRSDEVNAICRTLLSS